MANSDRIKPSTLSGLTTPRITKSTNRYHRSWYLGTVWLEERPAPAFAHSSSCCTTLHHNNSVAFPWVPFSGTALHPFSAFESEVCYQIVDFHMHWLYFWPCQSSIPSLPVLCFAMEGLVLCIHSHPLHQYHPNSGPPLRAFR